MVDSATDVGASVGGSSAAATVSSPDRIWIIGSYRVADHRCWLYLAVTVAIKFLSGASYHACIPARVPRCPVVRMLYRRAPKGVSGGEVHLLRNTLNITNGEVPNRAVGLGSPARSEAAHAPQGVASCRSSGARASCGRAGWSTGQMDAPSQSSRRWQSMNGGKSFDNNRHWQAMRTCRGLRRQSSATRSWAAAPTPFAADLISAHSSPARSLA